MTLIPGDGIGPVCAESVQTIFEAVNIPVDFQEVKVKYVTFFLFSPWSYYLRVREEKLWFTMLFLPCLMLVARVRASRKRLERRFLPSSGMVWP